MGVARIGKRPVSKTEAVSRAGIRVRVPYPQQGILVLMYEHQRRLCFKNRVL